VDLNFHYLPSKNRMAPTEARSLNVDAGRHYVVSTYKAETMCAMASSNVARPSR
jgi:hypothetical protein